MFLFPVCEISYWICLCNKFTDMPNYTFYVNIVRFAGSACVKIMFMWRQNSDLGTDVFVFFVFCII